MKGAEDNEYRNIDSRRKRYVNAYEYSDSISEYRDKSTIMK